MPSLPGHAQGATRYGPRVPLLMFGGRVRKRIDSRWCSHVSIPRTALQLLGLPPSGVPRLDADNGLADLVDLSATATICPTPPRSGTTSTLPHHRNRRRFPPPPPDDVPLKPGR